MTVEILTFTRRTRIEAPAEAVFAWHARPGAFERLAPPWVGVTVDRRTGGIRDGGRVELRVPLGLARVRWICEHRDYVEGRQFRDVQITGPFASWTHTHRFEPAGPLASWLEDSLEYSLPLGLLGRALAGANVREKLDRVFRYRHEVTSRDITSHLTSKGSRPMNVLVTGSTGLVGSALVPFLTTGGHHVTRLVRRRQASSPGAAITDVEWDPAAGRLDSASLEGIDAAVHLAGENIGTGRWTAAKKAKILDSRVRGTRLLCESLAKLSRPPGALVSASAIGIYGSRGDEPLTEENGPGAGFLADVCRQWEAAVEPAEKRGIRVARLRCGVVLSPAGGALAKMLLPFKLGAGGVVGSGKQYVSWIALDDMIGVIHHALITESLRGPVNAVTPNPVTNRELTKTLGRVLGRPTVFPLPAFAARVAFGEMAEETILSSARVEPAKLRQSGYAFRHPELEGALRHLLGKA
jgi:uncharacterized protein (TIGR01777 family)